MATVYRAIQEGPHGFENEVALKLFKPEIVKGSPAVVRMIVDEARIASRLKHPGIVRILDLVEEEGRLYTVMDWVDGPSMRQVLDAARSSQRLPSAPAVVQVLARACKGLHAAHTTAHPDGSKTGLVHRDVKPGNILLSMQGEVKLSDFGIALFSDRLAEATAQGKLKGTPAYMSPEQVFGEPMDFRSDIFSMGLTLFTLCTTRLAFTGESPMKIAVKIAEESLEPHAAELDALLPGLGRIFVRATEKEPTDRYRSASELGDALESLYRGLDSPTSFHQLLDMGVWDSPPPDDKDQEDAERVPTDLIPTVLLPSESLSESKRSSETPGLSSVQVAHDGPDTEPNFGPPGKMFRYGATDEDTDTEAEVTDPGIHDDPEPTDPGMPASQLLAAAPSPPPTLRSAAAPRPSGLNSKEEFGQSYRHERDYRGRVVRRKIVDPSSTEVSRWERLGIGVLGVGLIALVLVILIAHLTRSDTVDVSEQNSEAKADAEPANATPIAVTPKASKGSEIETQDNEPNINAEPAAPAETKPAPAKSEPVGSGEKVAAVAATSGEKPRSKARKKPGFSSSKKRSVPTTSSTSSSEVPPSSPATEAPGFLVVNSYPFSEVFVDGEARGRTPLAGLKLAPGVHEVKLVFPNLEGREIVKSVRIRSEQTSRVVERIQDDGE